MFTLQFYSTSCQTKRKLDIYRRICIFICITSSLIKRIEPKKSRVSDISGFNYTCICLQTKAIFEEKSRDTIDTFNMADSGKAERGKGYFFNMTMGYTLFMTEPLTLFLQ